MKILGAVSASAFTFLLLLESVEPSNVFKCASGDIFYMGAIYDLALKAEYQFSCPDHPLSPDGEKCKAYSFTNPSEIISANFFYLVQVYGTIDYHRLYQWYDFKWTECKLQENDRQRTQLFSK
ncbi:BgtE-20047 [Blumeria graminis f. sp. tritici]|uniref:BgtE-20047 n=2 Tax=Blumeria graminis f. sp. tritici TaxID=62690 RepID=A0A381LHY2_BLUGR|nr:BgtE-20047 [Blumeria graminis f. sp. tritici]